MGTLTGLCHLGTMLKDGLEPPPPNLQSGILPVELFQHSNTGTEMGQPGFEPGSMPALQAGAFPDLATIPHTHYKA